MQIIFLAIFQEVFINHLTLAPRRLSLAATRIQPALVTETLSRLEDACGLGSPARSGLPHDGSFSRLIDWLLHAVGGSSVLEVVYSLA